MITDEGLNRYAVDLKPCNSAKIMVSILAIERLPFRRAGNLTGIIVTLG